MNNLLEKNYSFYVAGHNGMVGKSIVKELLKQGYCNKNSGGKLLTRTRKELDLTCYQDVFSWFKINKPDVVIIAAAKVGGILANHKYPFDFISENLKIQQNIIESAWLNKTKRLLFLGSSCIYPKYPNLPITEEELLKSELEKTNESYAIAKIAGIKLCEAIRKQHGFDAICLMPTNLYGLGDNFSEENSHVIPSLLKKFVLAKKHNNNLVRCWGTGNPMRDFLHVDDLASACVHVLEKWSPEDKNAPRKKNGEKLFFLNVGSGKEITIKELAELIAKLTNFNGDILWDTSKPDGTFRKKLNSSRIRLLGWEPKINLESGLSNLIEEIKSILEKTNNKNNILKNF